ncbi:chitinase domain-containing protein 1-like isoform X2 [Argiope bruennichi]|uniref:Chitinase domain-containing protein 1 n=1 Tax=Argiope bruennichi TaxID=94029 RepID=A0A8T0FI01_ARGBR|nr:chitinase domain-containing protein 1-like isoform X2 [Argiope bruennichi]KAF8790072.1 Chitinase domain-containing protein 1 [Argiope bruennichi]
MLLLEYFSSQRSNSRLNNKLTSVNVDFQSILDEYKSYSFTASLVRHFEYDVLGYVTPWNNHGYNIAKLYAAKFSMVSPVWLQIKPKNEKGGFMFQGLQDIDRDWVASVKLLNPYVRFVPRIILEHWTYPTLKKFLTEKIADLTTELVLLSKDNQFDGYVFEIWGLLGGKMKAELTQFIITMSKELRKHNLILILVIPPPTHFGEEGTMFHRQDFDKLSKHVTAFSLMTYDFSNPERPGPNSPVPWLRHCVEALVPESYSTDRQKLLLGLNFYGYVYWKFGGKPIVGHEYLSILKQHKPKFEFDDFNGEHSFTYRTEENGFEKEYEVYYPTLYSIKLRIELARELRTGIAIWETGQGLNYFYDLL